MPPRLPVGSPSGGHAPRTGIEEQARSSGGEHHIDTVGVSGSNPLEPTSFFVNRRLVQLGERILHTDEVNGSIPLAPTKSSSNAGATRVFLFLSLGVAILRARGRGRKAEWKPWP